MHPPESELCYTFYRVTLLRAATPCKRTPVDFFKIHGTFSREKNHRSKPYTSGKSVTSVTCVTEWDISVTDLECNILAFDRIGEWLCDQS